MKIAHLVLSLGKGGAEKLLVDNLPLYKKNDCDVSIIQLSSILEEPSFIKEMEDNNIKVYTLSKTSFKHPKYFRLLRNLINKEKFDIVHVHLFPNIYYISVLKLFRLINCKIVLTEHSSKNGRTNKLFFQIIEPYFYKQYDKIISISQSVNSMLIHRFYSLKDKIVLINNGVDLKKFTKAIPYNIEEFKNQYNISTKYILLMVSRFSDPKDQITLIECIKDLYDVTVLFVGDGDQLEACKTLANEFKDRIKFLGFRNDIPQLMKTVDMNILSSHYEGFSGVTLESLASGKPFLGSNVPGIKEIVPNSQFLFYVGDKQDLAKKINNILSDKRLYFKMQSEALEYVLNFSNEKMIYNHLNLYKNLIK